MSTVWFDMDGTINQFYQVDGYVNYIIHESTFPYDTAKPNLNFSLFARYLNIIQRHGAKIGIISWLAGGKPTPEYDKAVTTAKLAWLNKHLPSVKWDEIHIVKHGTIKNNFITGEDDVLFDDEERNRIQWTGRSYPPEKIMEILKQIAA